MAFSFWDDLELWEKLTFILGVAIVLVVITGYFKRGYNVRRLRKYTKLASAEDELRHTLTHSGIGTTPNEVEIPFGIRALEAGTQVEGIWISYPNTPRTSVSASPNPSSPEVSSPEPTGDKNPFFESNTPATAPKIPEIPAPTYNVPRLRMPTPPSARRTSYQPRRSSGLRHSDNYELEEMAPQSRPPTSGSDSRILSADRTRASLSSWSTVTYNDSYYTHGESLVLNKPTPEHSMNLRSYTPTTTRQARNVSAPATSRSPAPQSPESDGTSPIDGDKHSPAEATNPFLTPTHTEGSNATATSTPTPASVYNTTASKPETRIPTTVPTNTNPSSSSRPEEARFSNTDRQSQVIRKVNSGFEILRPGSLGQPPPGVATGGDGNVNANTHAHIQGGNNGRNVSKEREYTEMQGPSSRKKLQKRNRPRKSSFVERSDMV